MNYFWLKNNHSVISISCHAMHHDIFAMGNDTFRLDYYSASNMLSSIERQFVH
ncbi:hypothetical protein [Pantoea sp. ME81]|uniref:hypothetical protein n=1 Tax=Pantoea sp. ME81 TaxID=2743935 RepID=UPI0015F4042C|nr:hypothetical protein [Pantoea sp. ME81]